MSRAFRHVLFIAEERDYGDKLGAIVDALQGYRAGDEIDWRSRVESWLSNFEGLRDQRLAFGMLERLRVVSAEAGLEGCRALLDHVKGLHGKETRIHHLAHESSGALLLRMLEKKLGVRHYQLLRPNDFTRLNTLGKLRDGDVIAIWDTFNGTGRTLEELAERYSATFATIPGKTVVAIHFAFLAGHPPAAELPPNVHVHRWIEDPPLCTKDERDMCDRYAAPAGAMGTNRNYETGALITFADNPPNNVPLVLRARHTDTWFTLLDRDETRKP